jgi:hypothetical protein
MSDFHISDQALRNIEEVGLQAPLQRNFDCWPATWAAFSISSREATVQSCLRHPRAVEPLADTPCQKWCAASGACGRHWGGPNAETLLSYP